MQPTNNPVHLMIAPTFLTANSDVDAPAFGANPYLRLAKRWDRRRPGASHVRPGYLLARGMTGFGRWVFSS